MKKLVKESLNEDYHMDDDPERDRLFLENEIRTIKGISSISEVDRYVFEHTAGHHFPFNPIEPIRSIFREKLTQLQPSAVNERENAIISQLLRMVEGEWKSIDIPDGAMY